MERGAYSKIGLISYQTKKINELIENRRIALAKKLALELLSDYSYDTQLLKALSRIYMIERDYENAIRILESIDETCIYKRLVSIYLKLNDEEKLYELYQKYFCDDSILDEQSEYNESSRRFKIYLEKRFNPSFDIDIYKLSYFEKQIYDYDETRAINHIEKHHCSKYSKAFNDDVKSIFNEDIDIIELFNKVKKSISNNSEKGNLGKGAGETYYFAYRNCGLRNDNGDLINSDTIKVCTLIGTNQIVSMYPNKEVNVLELCSLESQNVQSKIKVKTGMERFNSRYKSIK